MNLARHKTRFETPNSFAKHARALTLLTVSAPARSY